MDDTDYSIDDIDDELSELRKEFSEDLLREIFSPADKLASMIRQTSSLNNADLVSLKLRNKSKTVLRPFEQYIRNTLRKEG